EGWAARLHAEQRIHRAERRVLPELAQVFLESARILSLQLNARRPAAVGVDEVGHAFGPDRLGIGARGLLKLRPPGGRRTVAAAGEGERDRALRVCEPEMQR